MTDWNNASLGEPEQKQNKEPEITTDDLVLMIGESTIKQRHSERVTNHFKNQILSLQSELAKEKSLNISLKEKIGKGNDEIVIQMNSLKARILQLEDQTHAIALERDEVKKERDEVKNDNLSLHSEIELLKAKKNKKVKADA